MELLTAELVEEIQNLLPDRDRIVPLVANLRDATLTGIMEYGCLRWATKSSLPPLPSTIVNSPLGAALAEVRSSLGLRSSGPPKPPFRRLDVQPAEFHVIECESDIVESEWECFLTRFDWSAQSIGLSSEIAGLLQAALLEMAENAVLHAAAPTSALVGYSILKGVAQFCVVDVGIGVLASLKTCSEFESLNLHNEAIKMALQDGASRFGPGHGGFGFRRVFKSLASQWGSLRFRSGEGCISMDGNHPEADKGMETYPPAMPGFQVSVSCRAMEKPHQDPLI